MYKVAILYICTGKYRLFWSEFYRSCEQYFLKNIAELHYFVWTDESIIENQSINQNRIHQFYQAPQPWPYNTLKRFDFFLSAKDQLKEFDFVFFMNANLLITREIGLNFLPLYNDLLVVNHPGAFFKSPQEFTYERNPQSTAYIPMGQGDYYVAGGLNGGKTEPFLAMCEQLSANIKQDEQNGIIALWHDESHLNRYILDNLNYKILEPAYLYPEGWRIPFQMKIQVREKSFYFNVDEFKSK